jgi:hypothetical protein
VERHLDRAASRGGLPVGRTLAIGGLADVAAKRKQRGEFSAEDMRWVVVSFEILLDFCYTCWSCCIRSKFAACCCCCMRRVALLRAFSSSKRLRKKQRHTLDNQVGRFRARLGVCIDTMRLMHMRPLASPSLSSPGNILLFPKKTCRKIHGRGTTQAKNEKTVVPITCVSTPHRSRA